MPATITVMNSDDAGLGSLREAIELANTMPGADTIDFAPAVGGTITLLTALPDLSTDVIVSGPGATSLAVARSAAPGTPAFRIFTVPEGADVMISGLTITGGQAVEGGGISNSGTLTVTASTLSGNSATNDGGSRAIRGGGISNSGTLRVTNSTLSGNSVSGSRGFFSGSEITVFVGGGISNSGTLTVTDSTLSGNSASGLSFFLRNHIDPGQPSGLGGGISNSGTLSVTNSTLSGNSANSNGGGIQNDGTLSVTNSTLSGNSAIFHGGGIRNFGALSVIGSTLSGNSANGDGGGIENFDTLTVTNSTLSGNSAIFHGGGMSNWGRLTIIASTLSGNSAGVGGGIFDRRGGERRATTSLFANPAGGDLISEASTAFVSGGHNLFSDTPGVALDPTDLVNTDPLLGPLADNGGPTSTHALLPGSPAIDAGLAVAGVSTDQRGIARPQGAAPDIGAFESRGFTLAVVRGDIQRTPAGSAFPLPLVVRVASPFGEPVTGGRVTFAAPPTGGSAALSAEFATIDADGLASVDATAIGAGASYAVTARAAGANGVAFLLANGDVPPPVDSTPTVPTDEDVPPPVASPPTVVALRRFGERSRRTTLMLTFSTALDSARAQDPGNYRLVVRGRPRRTIRVRSARYDPSQNSVTLAPVRRLPLWRGFVLTVNGTAPDGLTSTSGIPLAGRGGGQAGTDFVARIDRAALVRPVSPPAGNRDRPDTGSRP